MVNRIADILKIIKEQDLKDEFGKFEENFLDTIQPLRDKLQMTVMTSEVPQLELHMAYVESWRERVSMYNALATAFVEHCKSSTFSLTGPTGAKITQVDKEAYQKSLSAGFTGIRDYTQELIKTVDSRVNLCKKLLGFESDASNPGLRR